jgi:hypothetical protein
LILKAFILINILSFQIDIEQGEIKRYAKSTRQHLFKNVHRNVYFFYHFRLPLRTAAAKPMIEALELRQDYWWEVGGELESQAETMEKLTRWMDAPLLFWYYRSSGVAV